MAYTKEERLDLDSKVYITKKVKDILDAEQKKLRDSGVKMSVAKIVCNLILEKYEV